MGREVLGWGGKGGGAWGVLTRASLDPRPLRLRGGAGQPVPSVPRSEAASPCPARSPDARVMGTGCPLGCAGSGAPQGGPAPGMSLAGTGAANPGARGGNPGTPGSGLTLRPASFAESSQSATAGAAAEPRVSQRCAGRGRRRRGQWVSGGPNAGTPSREGAGTAGCFVRRRPGGSSLSPLCPVQVPVSPSPTPMSATARPSGTRGRRSSGCA